ncbi:MAG: hypothetical protein M3151_04425 [Actinomycetota bacterium]|nr:hypothetical protein [Actinomycetota bacterium]
MTGLGFSKLDLSIREIRLRTPLGELEIVAGELEDECAALFEALIRRAGGG